MKHVSEMSAVPHKEIMKQMSYSSITTTRNTGTTKVDFLEVSSEEKSGRDKNRTP